MAGGWARDGAVQEQIEASISDELKRMEARAGPRGVSLTHCAECEEPIPEARRAAIPGVKLCIECQREGVVGNHARLCGDAFLLRERVLPRLPRLGVSQRLRFTVLLLVQDLSLIHI